MAKYLTKPVMIEAITFEQLTQYGMDLGPCDRNGMPTAFVYMGNQITSLDKDAYTIRIPYLGTDMMFVRGDILVTGPNGRLYVYKRDIFDLTFNSVNQVGMANQISITANERAFEINCAGKTWHVNNFPAAIRSIITATLEVDVCTLILDRQSLDALARLLPQ